MLVREVPGLAAGGVNHLVIPSNVTKEPVVCPECLQRFGQTFGGLFRSRFVNHNTMVGVAPAFIHCGVCGGVWANPEWTFSASIPVILRQIESLPRSDPPERNWAAVPNDRRPRALRVPDGAW